MKTNIKAAVVRLRDWLALEEQQEAPHALTPQAKADLLAVLAYVEEVEAVRDAVAAGPRLHDVMGALALMTDGGSGTAGSAARLGMQFQSLTPPKNLAE